MVESVAPLDEAIDLIIEAGGESLKFCHQCGLCDTTCQWNLVKTFMVRRLIREAQFGLAQIEGESIWQCATCGNCVACCPRGVEIIDILDPIEINEGQTKELAKLKLGNPQRKEEENQC